MTGINFNFGADPLLGSRDFSSQMSTIEQMQAELEQKKAAILQAASHPKLLSDPAPVVILSAYLDSAIEYQFLGWTATENYLEVRNHVNGSVKKEFDRQGISIPYPQVDVHLQK